MLEVFIGPNGYGKTTKLEKIMKDSIDNHGVLKSNILFLESELLLLNEMKDTTDTTKSMEYILSELIETTAVINARTAFETAVDIEINSNVTMVNGIVDSIIQINSQTRIRDFMKISTNKVYKGLVKIDQSEIKNKMGSGQRMQLILELASRSSKTHIFLDEPEKYSHPSLLHRTAEMINSLSLTRNVYIATHSPKLLSMIDMDLDNIKILNDITYVDKTCNFAGIVSAFPAHSTLLSSDENLSKSFSYFNVVGLKNNIKNLHYREFLEALFSKNVYLIEGVNDELFIKKMLQDNGKYYSDYSIFNTYGKHHMMLFAKMFSDLSINVHIYFDKDNSTGVHESSNRLLSAYPHYMFTDNIELEFGYEGHKYDTPNFIGFLNSFTIGNTYDI